MISSINLLSIKRNVRCSEKQQAFQRNFPLSWDTKFIFTDCTWRKIFFHESKRLFSVETTNKMQPCNRIYYSTVHWRLNMLRAACCSSSWALTVLAASGLYTHVVTGRSQTWVGTPLLELTWLRSVTACVCKPDTAITVRAPDGERYAARNTLSLQWTVE
jgi:hypothetical protein